MKKKFILTAAHCITHSRNGFIEKVEKVRIRIPKLDSYETMSNEAKLGKIDKRFLYTIARKHEFHVSPDYFTEASPNTGDDLGLIELNNEKIVQEASNNCKFWNIKPRDDMIFSMNEHASMMIIYF